MTVLAPLTVFVLVMTANGPHGSTFNPNGNGVVTAVAGFPSEKACQAQIGADMGAVKAAGGRVVDIDCQPVILVGGDYAGWKPPSQ